MLGVLVFSNTYWTFWDVFALFFIFIPLVGMWFYSIFDVFRRRDMSGWSKALWLLAIIVVPYLGVIFYLLFSHIAESTAYDPA